jgi:bifunctional N-acetylglucosamine-1-phosphate-uridyltransferase/glucosamine-1-phosphate-acetyltransferase GlmU-like protein
MISNNFKADVVIPAAGLSKRFNSVKSKIFFKIKKKTLLEIILEKIEKNSNKIYIVVNKKDLNAVRLLLKNNKQKEKIKLLIQYKIDGMASAIKIASTYIKTKDIFIIWADQIYLKKNTIKNTLILHVKKKSDITFPICNVKHPYTKIIFDQLGNFIDILQKRETQINDEYALSDCGFFIIKKKIIIDDLIDLIKNKKIITKKTNEHDFIHSLKFFAKKYKINLFYSKYKKDSLGVNFMKDVK